MGTNVDTPVALHYWSRETVADGGAGRETWLPLAELGTISKADWRVERYLNLTDE